MIRPMPIARKSNMSPTKRRSVSMALCKRNSSPSAAPAVVRRMAGLWLLYAEQHETETVTFRTGLEGFSLYPGAVFKTTDPNRAGRRMGGRIRAATATEVTLDDAV